MASATALKGEPSESACRIRWDKKLFSVVRKIAKISNSQGLIFVAALKVPARIKVGDQMFISLHEGGSIVLTPLGPVIRPGKLATTAKHLIKQDAELCWQSF